MKKLVSDVMIELHVSDFEVAKTFYGDLGFTVVWERKTEALNSRFLVMRRGEYSVLNFFGGRDDVFTQSYFQKFPANTPRGYAVEFTIPIDGLLDFYENIKKKYPEHIVQHPDERTFRAGGRKDFRMVDPFGYYLCFVERYNWVDGRDEHGNPIT